MTATLFFVTNIVVLYNAYNREPQTWFCVIRQISRISKSGVFKGGISPSGLSPLALYADYPFIIRSYAIYKRQGKAPDGASPECVVLAFVYDYAKAACVAPYLFCVVNRVYYFLRNTHGNESSRCKSRHYDRSCICCRFVQARS